MLISSCQSTRPGSPYLPPSDARIIQAHFKHLVFQGPGSDRRLHVYIEGDGLPFINRFQLAQDPSSRHPLMPWLMAMDDHESLFLGRPCYFNRALAGMEDKQCNPRFWSSARYSEEVVSSMVSALRQLLAGRTSGVTLIGHSGGGTLAVLMAQRMPEVDQVVTLAANLDTDAWVRLHHYTPMRDSLNPATYAAPLKPIWQLHFAGGRDQNIPPRLGQAFMDRLGQRLHIIESADHNCCWLSLWPDLLKRINQQSQP